MRRFVTAALLALGLAGCASTPSVPVEIGPAAAERWTLQGRIGVQHGEESLSGQLRWQHRADADELLMTSPLGQGVARIVRDATGFLLEVPNQPSRRAPDAESLTHAALGYALPVRGLVWWVQARPDPDRPFEASRDGEGRLAQLRQDGWIIDYQQYATDSQGWPRKLSVAREGLRIRLIADSWQAE